MNEKTTTNERIELVDETKLTDSSLKNKIKSLTNVNA